MPLNNESFLETNEKNELAINETEDTIEIFVKIDKIREKFLEEYESNQELYDECDAQRIKESDWALKRFLLSNNSDEESTLKNLIDAMKWRKSFGVNTRTDDYFPEEFYKIGGLFQYNTDKEGLPLLYIRVCVHHKVTELTELIKQYFVHIVNKIDISSGGQWALLFDSSNSGLSNVDMDFSRFIIQVLQNYFPKGYKYVLIFEMPWIMVAFWKISRTWLSDEVKELIKFANGPQIFDFIEPENVPEYIPGGKCTKSINAIPDGVKPSEHLPHLDFTEEQIKRFKTIFNIESTETEKESMDENEN